MTFTTVELDAAPHVALRGLPARRDFIPPAARGRGLTLWLAWACVRGGVAWAQVDAPPPAPVDVAPHDRPRVNIDNPEVYLNDSFEASDALAKAQVFANRGRWTEAAEVLQRAIDGAGDKLVRVASGSYTGIRRHISDLIARWPRQGIAEYRRLFEHDIEAALAGASDSRSVDDLLPLFERYFCTAAAAKLADTIGQLAIEAGDLALAEHTYRRVLDRHPEAATYAPRYRAMLTVLAAIRGDTGPPTADEGDVRIRWMGQDRALRDVVAEIGKSFAGLREPIPPDRWPIFAGDADRNRAALCKVDDPGLLWRFDLAEPQPAGADREDRESLTRTKPDSARDLTIFPVVGDGLVFVQRFREIIALHQNTGAVAWRFGGDPRPGGGFEYLEDSPPGWDSPTLHEGRLYAALSGDESPYYSYESPRVLPELVCLDAKTGRLIWRVNQRSGDDPLSEVSFDSTPIVQYGRLYVVGRRRRTFGFEDCYLYRLNAADGSVERRTHLGSASTGTVTSRPATRTISALHGGTLYVCTNLGTVAAVSAHTGDVLWLRLYERFRADSREGPGSTAREMNPAQFNPLIWDAGRLIVSPTDAANVLVLSAESGEMIQSVPLEEIGAMEVLLGVRGGLLCGVGKEALCYDLAVGSTRWSTPLPDGTRPFGRGIWADDELLVPRREGLSRFRVADGRRVDAPWDAEGEGGNLLALPDQLLAASAGRIAAYVRKAEIWKALRDRMAASPSDPLPALELAEVALGAGEYAEAVAVLDEAVRRADHADPSAESTLADRVYADALKFVEVLAQRSKLEADILDRLYTYASRTARDTESSVRYRFQFADLFERYHQPDRALRLYQQVLRDRSLREWTGPPGVPTSRAVGAARAGSTAQTRIAKLLEQNGRKLYAPYETEAAQWLSSGRAAGDEAALRQVVETFPNSDAAPKALIACGEVLARAGHAEPAARQFAKAYHRYPKQVDRPALLRKIADTFEQAGMVEHAYRWLTKAVREYPTALVEHNGRSISIAQYRDRLAAARERVEPVRPKITLPLNHSYEREFDGKGSLLVPWFGDEPTSRWSGFYVYTSAGIRAFDARDGRERWAEPATVQANAELLIARSDLAVFATSYEVFALDVTTGARRWSQGEYPKHLVDPGADWEGGGAFRTHAVQSNRLVSVRDDGRMTCIAIDTGKLLWSETRHPVALGRVRVVDPWVVYHISQDGRAVLCLVEAETGAWLDAVMTDEKRPVEELFVTLEGRIIVVTSQTIASYDAETRTRLWQTPLAGPPRPASLLLDLDALYVSDDAGDLRKIDLDDGRLVWQSEKLVQRGEDDLTVQREGGSLIVSTTSSVSAVDSVTGLTLWRGTAPERCRLVSRLITDAYVAAVDLSDGLREGRAAAYFYDHRNASGVIPRDGGAPDLGPLSDVRAVLACDHALIIQTGSTIRGYANK